MKMLKKVSSEFEKKFILNYLREEDKEELQAMFGEGWYKETIKTLQDNDFLVMYVFDEQKNEIPIAIGGFYDFNQSEVSIASVWILSSQYIYRNKKLFFKDIKEKLRETGGKYKIMYNYIYKRNFSAKKWLKKLGFRFDNPNPEGLNVKEGFEFFYKVN